MVNGKVGEKVRGESVAEMMDKVAALARRRRRARPSSCAWRTNGSAIWRSSPPRISTPLAPNNPLMLSLSSSEGLVNTAMLERAFAAGLPRTHFGIIKDASGKPTGQLFGAAHRHGRLEPARLARAHRQDLQRSGSQINDRFLRAGVTTVTGHASGYTVTIMSQLHHQGRLNLRIRPDLDFARQNPMADQILRRTPNLVNFSLGDGMHSHRRRGGGSGRWRIGRRRHPDERSRS